MLTLPDCAETRDPLPTDEPRSDCDCGHPDQPMEDWCEHCTADWNEWCDRLAAEAEWMTRYESGVI
jgi:hypothetical protein